MNLIYSLLIFASLPSILNYQPKLNSKDFFAKILAADGIVTHEELNKYESIYNKILLNVKSAVEDEDEIYDKHESLFKLLHERYLKKYSERSYFSKLLKDGEYNCVTSVILYYLICSDLGLKLNLFKSPYHVYITANNEDNEEFAIELTDPVNGFDFDREEDKYIDFLLDYKLITKKELEREGNDAIYKEFISKSEKIKPIELESIYYSNLADYNLLEKKYYEAFNLIKKAIRINPDSTNIFLHNIVWSFLANKNESNKDSLTSFLLATIDSIPSSKEFQESLIKESALDIDKNIGVNNFDLADSVYNKLCNVLSKEKMSSNEMQDMEIEIKANKINSEAIRGEYEDAFFQAGKLINKYRNNENLLDLYVHVGNSYVNDLAFSGNYNKLKIVADSLFTNAPGIKSVKENYALCSVMYVVNSKLYINKPKEAEKILLNAHKKLPGNIKIKKGLGLIYHELAMAEIRNRNYKKAISLLKKGLKYDPDSYDLKHEIDLTKDLLPKK